MTLISHTTSSSVQFSISTVELDTLLGKSGILLFYLHSDSLIVFPLYSASIKIALISLDGSPADGGDVASVVDMPDVKLSSIVDSSPNMLLSPHTYNNTWTTDMTIHRVVFSMYPDCWQCGTFDLTLGFPNVC